MSKKYPYVEIKNPPKPSWACHEGKPCVCDNCWCEPEIIIMENGNKVIVHQEEN